MDADMRENISGGQSDDAVQEAPSVRAKSLRDEIFGDALTLDEVAYILGLDRTTVAKYLREQIIYAFQIGREWRVPEQELRRYVHRITRQDEPEERRAMAVGVVRKGGAERVMGKFPPPPPPPGLIQRGVKMIVQRFENEPHGETESLSAVLEKDRFQKFTKRARNVLALAQEEAQRLRHNYIGTEHLLLGLVREGEGVAAKVLVSLGVELERVRSGVEFIIGRGDQPVSGEVGLTPRAKKVIKLSMDEARRLGHYYIGTEHLLLGLIREGEGIAVGVLESLDLNLQDVRARTIHMIAGAESTGATPDMPPPVPSEAAGLVAEGDAAKACARCGAACPPYFRYCFNCGAALQGEDLEEPKAEEE
jgi:excisionase family DNA binding protein